MIYLFIHFCDVCNFPGDKKRGVFDKHLAFVLAKLEEPFLVLPWNSLRVTK